MSVGKSAMKAMAGEKKKESKPVAKKHKVHKMEIRHAANGGFIVEHKHAPSAESMMTSGPQEPEEHQIPDVAALQQHVADNMGDGQPAPAAPPAAPAPVE